MRALPPVDPLARRPAGDRHRQILDPAASRRPFATTSECARNRWSSRVGKSVRWCAPRDSSRRERGVDDGLGDVEHERQLEGRDPLGVERLALIVDGDVGRPRSWRRPQRRARRCAERVARSDRCRRLPPSPSASPPGSSRCARRQPRACNRLGLEPPLLVLAPAPAMAALEPLTGCREAYSAAARPARAPKTSSSGSELDPSRFAPLMLTQADLARRIQAGERRRAVDVGVHAAHHVVHDRTHRDQLGHRIDVLVLEAQLAHERDLRLDVRLAQVPEVECTTGP